MSLSPLDVNRLWQPCFISFHKIHGVFLEQVVYLHSGRLDYRDEKLDVRPFEESLILRSNHVVGLITFAFATTDFVWLCKTICDAECKSRF